LANPDPAPIPGKPLSCPVRFSVITADETETFYTGVHQVEDSGVLSITPDDESEPVIRLSPAFWQTVKERRGDELPAGEDEIDRIFSDERM
jgi:hypothetical protein